MRHHVKRLSLIGAVLVAALLFAGAASATTPFRGSFDDVDVFIDSDVCAAAPWGFDVHVVQHEFGFFDVFFNQDGSFAKLIRHVNYDATISANGTTLVERDTWERTFYADGTSRLTGSSVHIQGPGGGIILRDAGQIVFNDYDGSVNYSHGPHPQRIDDVSFCPFLAP
jgi:hypothetical protein